MANKADIRRDMLAKRSALSIEQAARACGYVCEKLADISLPEASLVAGYSPIRSEVDISQALIAYRQRNITACLPIVTEQELILKFREWTPETPMEAGAFGIMQPVGAKAVIPEVLLVPLVAFDRRGFRLGYGKGYYDATIACLKKTNPTLLTIGIGFSFQEVEALPDEPHDVRLSLVVTEREIVSCRA